MNYTKTLLLTADKQDFTTLLFERLNIFTFEDDKGNLTHFQLMKFSQSKFDSLQKRLDSTNGVVAAKGSEEVSLDDIPF